MSPPQGAHALTSSPQGTSSFDLAAARGLVTVGNDPPIDDIVDADFDLSDALQSVSRSNSPGLEERDAGETPRKKSDYDYSMSLRSEPKVSSQ